MLGGFREGRPLVTEGDHGLFEQTVNRAIGDRIRTSDDDAQDLWNALANVDWFGPNGAEIGYSFRAAGDFIAAIRDDRSEMAYMRFYCGGPDGTVAEWIADALGAEGWTPRLLRHSHD